MTIAATTAALPGRTRVTAKALDRIVSAVTAEALGVDAHRVGVDLSDAAGSLALTIRTPIRVTSLDRVRTGSPAVRSASGSIMDRVSRAQGVIRERVAGLTGSTISRVTIRITSADIKPEGRVR